MWRITCNRGSRTPVTGTLALSRDQSSGTLWAGPGGRPWPQEIGPRGDVVGTDGQPQAARQKPTRPRMQQIRPPSTIARRLARQRSRQGIKSEHPERRVSAEIGNFPCFRRKLPNFVLTTDCWSFPVSMLVIFSDSSRKIGGFMTDTNYQLPSLPAVGRSRQLVCPPTLSG